MPLRSDPGVIAQWATGFPGVAQLRNGFGEPARQDGKRKLDCAASFSGPEKQLIAKRQLGSGRGDRTDSVNNDLLMAQAYSKHMQAFHSTREGARMGDRKPSGGYKLVV